MRRLSNYMKLELVALASHISRGGMWLINTSTAELCYFASSDVVPGGYLILSHVWGEREDSFQSIQRLASSIERDPPLPHSRNAGATIADPLWRASLKVRGCCRFARSLGYTWAWLDSCCINKQSSAELSEALNSMTVWYTHADICVAYLEDVPDGDDPAVRGSAFWRSRWFKRGWTLQELLCPPYVLFLSRGWVRIGTKAALAPLIQEITLIDAEVLTFARPLSSVSVARRMAWAADRATSRIEDRAYSLMGIFGVNMPIIYGEAHNAFRRLQEEIMKASPDQTLFAWGFPMGTASGLFATSPGDFRGSDGMETVPLEQVPIAVEAFLTALTKVPPAASSRKKSLQMAKQRRPPPIPSATPTFTMTSHGVLARLPIIRSEDPRENIVAVLACRRRTTDVRAETSYVGLVLHPCATNHPLPHYVTGIANSRIRLVSPLFLSAANFGFDENSRLAAAWEKVYISPQTTVGDALPRTIAPHLPQWVRTHIRRRGFVMDPADTSALHWGDTLVLSFTRAPQELFQLHFRAGQAARESAHPLALWVGVTIREPDGSLFQLPREARDVVFSPDVDSRMSLVPIVDEGILFPALEIWRHGAMNFGDADRNVRVTLCRLPTDPTAPCAATVLVEVELGGRVYSELGDQSVAAG